MQVQIPRITLQPISSTVTHVSPWSAKGHVQPHRNHLPRCRKPRRFLHFDNSTADEPRAPAPPVEKVATPIAEPDPEALYKPTAPVNDPVLQHIMEDIWVAFAEGTEELADLPHDGGLPYTHIITIVHGDFEEGWSEQYYEKRVQRLRLLLPGSARAQRGRKDLALNDAQLRAARDFMGQAVPAGHNSNTRLLITTPFGRPTDAICVAICHLKATSDKTVEFISDALDADDDFHSVWRSEVSENELEKVDKIASAWSWLSQVAHPIRD